MRPLRVAMYEPLGQGGISHYTHALAQALSHRRDCYVTLLTPVPYELESRPREFRVSHLARGSRVKRLLLLGARLWPGARHARGKSACPDEPPAPVGGAKTSASRPMATLLRNMSLRLRQVGLALKLLMWRTDVVHFQWLDPPRDLFLFRLLRHLGFRVVHTAHNLLPHDGIGDIDPGVFEQVYRDVDRIIVHSEGNRREMHSLFGVDLREIEVIAHGSYDILLPGEPTGLAEARAQIGFPASGQIILFFGLIRPYKGLEFLVEAFDEVEKRFPNARLAIVGDILQADPDEHAFYSRLLEQAARRKTILCVSEYVAVDRVGLYFLAADVVVLPYTKTYQSGVLMAALAAGRPVVVTDTGGLPEIVENGKTGFVVPPRDAGALADAIGRILERPEMAAQMGRRASEHARSEFSWENIAAQTVDLYQRVVGKGRKRIAQPPRPDEDVRATERLRSE